MKHAKRKTAKSFLDLTPEERDREVARFDKPIDIVKDTKPLTLKQRLLFERMRGNRPSVSYQVRGRRHTVVIRLDDELMGRVRSFARKNKTSLPKMIDRGLRGLLSFAE